MKFSDMVKILKATGVGATTGLVTTTTVVGAEMLGVTIANAFCSIPSDGEKCLDTFSAQRQLDSKIILWSLLAFAPGFLIGALVFLSKQTDFFNPSASQYDIIDDDNQNGSMLEFFKEIMTSQEPLLCGAKKILIAMGIAFSFVGVLFGPVKFFIDDVNRDVFTPENCRSEMRGDVVFEGVMSFITFAMTFGAIMYFTSRLEQESTAKPAQQEAHQLPTASVLADTQYSL